MICKVCGTELNGAVKCPVCGNPAEQASYEGPVVGQNTFAAGTPVMADAPVMAAAPAKKSSKKIIGIIIAIVLVLGIAAAAVFMIVGGVFKSDISKVFGAVKKTVFDSSSMTVEVKVAGETFDGKLVIGEGLSDTGFMLDMDEVAGAAEGEIYIPYQGTQDISDLEEGLEEYTELADEYGLDIDATDIAETLLNKKIDEDALAKLYDETLKPWAEEAIEDEFDKSVTLPTYERTMELVDEFLNYCVEEEAIKIEKSKAEKGKQYTIDVKSEKVAKCLVSFCENTPELNDIMKALDLYEAFEDVDDWDLEDIDIVVVVDKKGYLAEVEAEMYDEEVSVVFTDINKTEITGDDVDEMEKWAEKEYSTSDYYDDYDDYEEDYYEEDVYEYCYGCGGEIYYSDEYGYDYTVDEYGNYYHMDCY